MKWSVVIGIGGILLLVTLLAFVMLRFVGSSQTTSGTRNITNLTTRDMANNNSFSLTSSAFDNGGIIPAKYTCDGENINPPLMLEYVPHEAESLVLIMYDPDVPRDLKPDGIFDHWVLYNISSDTIEIKEGEAPIEAVVGINSVGKREYTGPCPPTQYEPTEHRYFFDLYALNIEVDVLPGASKEEVKEAINGHVIDKTTLIGRYDRTQQ